MLNATRLECDCNPRATPEGTESIHEAELAIHREKLLARSSVEAIHTARESGVEVDETHELVIAMRGIHSNLRNWRLQRNKARRRDECAQWRYENRSYY